MECSTQKADLQVTLSQSSEACKSVVESDQVSLKPTGLLEKFGDLLAALFKGSDEIRVWQRLDRNGHLWWYAYNPRTQQSGAFDSESDIRAWIERQMHV